MKRLRWFAADWPVTFRVLGARMNAKTFTEESFDGFLVDRIRDQSIEARFAEKLVIKETIVDPFGKEHIFERVAYQQFVFRLFREFPNVEIHDAPRNTQGFMNRLLELNNFSTSVTPIVIDLLKWVDAFHAELERPVVVDSMQMSEVEFEPGIMGKITLRGDTDIRHALPTVTRGHRYILQKLQLKVVYDTKAAVVQLGSAGSVNATEDRFEELYSPLRKSLQVAAQNR